MKNMWDTLNKRGGKLPGRATTPFSGGYRSEVDVSLVLKPDDVSYYQSIIGILRRVELERVDVCYEVSLMSSLMALPREGHLEQVLRRFAYFGRNARWCLIPVIHR